MKKDTEDKEDTKSRVMESNPSITLYCGHTKTKNNLIYSSLWSFLGQNSYKHSIYCKPCDTSIELCYIPLYCGCIWTNFEKKIKVTNDLTKADYGKCDKGHPLTSIDLGLLNDHINLKFTSLILSDFQEDKKYLMDAFSNNINRKGIREILWMLRYSKAVSKLSLYGISPQNRKLILNILKTNESVRELDFNEEAYGTKNVVLETEDIKGISEVLKVDLTLTKLYLRRCTLTDECVKIICEALKTNTALTSLFLGSNNIEDEGMKTIDELLKINNTLEELELHSNKITDKYIGLLCETLIVNTGLRYMNLRYNKLEAEGKNLLNEVQEKYNLMEILH